MRALDVKKTKEQLSILEVVTRAYSEIASMNMKRTRDDVLSNRDFLADLATVFDDVRLSFAEELQKTKKKKGGEEITFLSHNGKTVSVLLSSNSGLYGKIVAETFNLFAQEVAKNKTEVTIVGRQGLALFTAAFPGKAHTYFDVEDKNVDQHTFSQFARHIVEYDEIHLFYGKFHNIVKQQPDMLPINSKIDLTTGDRKAVKFLFEPNITSIIQFFERELFASLLTQTMQESNLAKYASRVIAMDEASSRITQERKKMTQLEMALLHREANKKQLNVVSSLMQIL